MPVYVPGREPHDGARQRDVKRLVQSPRTAHAELEARGERDDVENNNDAPTSFARTLLGFQFPWYVELGFRSRRSVPLSSFVGLARATLAMRALAPCRGAPTETMFRSRRAAARIVRLAFAPARARAPIPRFAMPTRAAVAGAPAARSVSGNALDGKLPAFDYTALIASVCEIHELAVPTKVEVAVQADAYTLVLGLRGLEGKRALHVSWHPNAARVCLGPPPPRVHKTDNLSFGEQCHANLRGLILVRAALPEPWERLAVFDFAERPGAPPAFRLHVETQGRNSNAVLVDARDGAKIVACAYQVGAAQTSVRPMSPGFPYVPPPPAPGVPPETVADADEWRGSVLAAAAMARNDRRAKAKPESDVTRGMVRAFQGVSPALASALAANAGVSADASADALDDDEWSALREEFSAWVASTSAAVATVAEDSASGSSRFDGWGWCPGEGQLLLHAPAGPGAAREGGHAPLSAAAMAADPEGAGGPVGALFAAVYGDAGDEDVFRREKDRLLRGTRAALKKNAQKTRAFRKQIDDAADHEATKNRADEIMAYQHAYVAGSTSLEVYDFETGEAKTVDVDPTLGPTATAEALYKKARKRRKTAGAVEPLLEAAATEAAYLEQVEFTLVELDGTGEDDRAALEEIAAELVDAKLMAPVGKGAAAAIRREEKGGKGGKRGGKNAPAGGGGKRKAREEAMANVRRYSAPSGKEVLVGRNSKGNEAVSLRIGQDQDVWFHARGAPGAHVILRQQPGQEASDEDMRFAADLAAFHSKLRTGGNVDVSWTSPKHVRKPSGARLGMVTIDKERTMTGRPDESAAAKEEARERAESKKGKGVEAW